jgi:hypothetical protein
MLTNTNMTRPQPRQPGCEHGLRRKLAGGCLTALVLVAPVALGLVVTRSLRGTAVVNANTCKVG